MWIVIGQIMVVSGALAAVGWLTRLMNIEQYGEFSLGLTTALFVNQVIMGPLGSGIMRFHSIAVARKQEGQYWKGVDSCMRSAASAVFILGLAGGGTLWLIGRPEWAMIFCVSMGYSLASGFSSMMLGIKNAERKRATAAIQQGTEMWARVLFAAILIVIIEASSAIALLGYAVASIGTFIFQIILSSRERGGMKIVVQDNSASWGRDIWSYSRPMVIFGAFTWLQMASDRWAIGWFYGPKEVGLYAVVLQLGSYPISVATGMAVQFVAPIVYQKSGDGSDESGVKKSRAITMLVAYVFISITAVACGVAILFHQWIFRVFLIPEYWEVSYLLPWMVISGGLFSYGQLMALNLMTEMKTGKLTAVKITTSVMGVVFALVGAVGMGVAGVVYAGVVFSAIYAFWMAIASRKTKALS